MDAQTCTLIEISRGTTHDGPGMRTTVFLKGCPLNCRWCQNPEGIKSGQEIWWEGRKCIRCLSCVAACPLEALTETDARPLLDRDTCDLCGACVEACPAVAMTFTGQEWTLDKLLDEALKDKDYYEAFGGGVTVSGGEPLRQHRFVSEFFRRLQAEGVNTALDTCGLAPREALDSVLPFTDCVLYDLKLMDSAQHRTYTGQPNEAILTNLLYIADRIRAVNAEREAAGGQGMRLWIRTPLIPDTTATPDNIAAIGRFIHDNIADVVERWELCAFNSTCKSKYQKMDRPWAYEGYELMSQDFVNSITASALSTGVAGERLVVSGLIARAGA